VLSLTHGVVQLEQLSPDYGTARRRMTVKKMRGVHYREGYHDYTILKGGLRIFPRLVAAEHHVDFDREAVSSGVPELDQLPGGGLARGTTTLIIGPAGTGKSSIAMQFAVHMARDNEAAAIFAFDETLGILKGRAESLGLPLNKHIESGNVRLRQIDPAEISPGEFAWSVRECVDAGCKLIVIDSLNGYLNAMPGEKYLNSQLHELSAYLNQLGVVTILVMAQHGMVTALEAPVDLSYLCDTVINMRYFEAAGEMKQSVAVIKKRSGNHERAIREFMLDGRNGIRIGQPLRDFRNLLTGAPTFEGTHETMLQSQKRT
jgi:circadian clock protein KaiC